jgi:hypothetical protein
MGISAITLIRVEFCCKTKNKEKRELKNQPNNLIEQKLKIKIKNKFKKNENIASKLPFGVCKILKTKLLCWNCE